MHLTMVRVGSSFDSFSIFLLSFKTPTKSHENYVFLYPFSNMAISCQNDEKTVFYTGKLYGLTGMQMYAAASVSRSSTECVILFGGCFSSIFSVQYLCECACKRGIAMPCILGCVLL